MQLMGKKAPAKWSGFFFHCADSLTLYLHRFVGRVGMKNGDSGSIATQQVYGRCGIKQQCGQVAACVWPCGLGQSLAGAATQGHTRRCRYIYVSVWHAGALLLYTPCRIGRLAGRRCLRQELRTMRLVEDTSHCMLAWSRVHSFAFPDPSSVSLELLGPLVGLFTLGTVPCWEAQGGDAAPGQSRGALAWRVAFLGTGSDGRVRQSRG